MGNYRRDFCRPYCGKGFREKRMPGKRTSRPSQTDMGKRRDQGNNGEDAELVSIAPECHTSHRALFCTKVLFES